MDSQQRTVVFESSTALGSQNSDVQKRQHRKVSEPSLVNTCRCLSRWVAAESIEDAAQLLNVPVSRVQQDTDVLDTWFSSALIPLVVAGDWPAHRNLNFPLLDVMQTGHDIIGFWIARMMTICHRFISRSY